MSRLLAGQITVSRRQVPRTGRLDVLTPELPVRFSKKTASTRTVPLTGQLEVLTPDSDSTVSNYEESIASSDDSKSENTNDDNDSRSSKFDIADNEFDPDFDDENRSNTYDCADNDFDQSFSECDDNDLGDASDCIETHVENGRRIAWGDNSKIDLDYDNGIKLQTTENNRQIFERFTTLNWSVFDRNLNLQDIVFSDDKKFASDIFKIIAKQMDTSDTGQRKSVKFSFDEDMKEHILFKVPVFESYLQVDQVVVNKLYEFSVFVEADGNWNEMPAKFENEFATFSCCCVNSFCIRSKAKQIAQVICPKGMTIKTGADGKLVVKFPEGCVTQDENIAYEIIRPAITDIKVSLPEWNPNLLIAVSDKICLKFTRKCLKTPIYLSFPIPGNKMTRPGTEPRLIGFKKGRPILLKTVGKQVGDDILYEVKGCDGAAMAIVQVENVRHREIQHTLAKELDIFYGSRILCNILLFVTTKINDRIRFMAYCVIQAEKQEVIKNITESGAPCIFKSDTLCLHPLHRIRIQVGGITGVLPGYANNLFLTFLCESKNNSINFPAFIGAGGTPYSIIEFALDNIDRRVVSKVHFEPYWPFKSFYKWTSRS